jgi:hypothetical protein
MRFDSTHKDMIVGYIFNIKHLAFIGIGISTLIQNSEKEESDLIFSLCSDMMVRKYRMHLNGISNSHYQ